MKAAMTGFQPIADWYLVTIATSTDQTTSGCCWLESVRYQYE